jgi:hypothetical protein
MSDPNNEPVVPGDITIKGSVGLLDDMSFVKMVQQVQPGRC